MRRDAKPGLKTSKVPTPTDIGAQLRAWIRERGMSQEEVARWLGIRQPQVSRILAGSFSLRSRAVRIWCVEAGISLEENRPARGATRKELVTLLDAVWDGTADDAARVAALLRAAAALR